MVEEENLAYINPEQDYMAQDEMQTILGTPSEESSLPTPENSESDSAIFEELSEVSNEGEVNQSEEHISEDFAENLFNIANIEQDLPDTILFNAEESDISQQLEPNLEVEALTFEDKDLQNDVSVAFTGDLSTNLEDSFAAAPQVEIKQGIFAPLHNAPLKRKPWIIAAITGLVSAVSVGVVGFALTNLQPDAAERKFSPLAQTGLISLAAGIASFGTTAVIGSIAAKRMKLASMDLQAQFEAVYQGNLSTQAKIYSQDEFGQMANAFNRMARVIATTTTEAQRRAEETEQAKEDLQRQVIRLLDDVEGAARGDLTVQATVTADVLGAVADAFNLTIQSLQEIVKQVKQAAEQVNKGSKDSELFARNQSSDALRMAEELAVTLNSVQMMTESIQRVAENAREAEKVARDSSASAIKGGEAVERTVSGILQIRETVSETARKVKRLAEASQEISKIVVLISQIAERTNQLALNASIQAAKAGDAGRGFAVVADEVRQLADRSGKALKEIEQIVLQIQSETGSVMTAMEEGIQEVIDVTERAEQAKRSLEDIIEVSQHIDNLVGSITADTVKQKENSFAVTQVMQSVEMTAQETSQESQRVAGSLQNLVTISQELLSSVEKFRLE
ncbi:MAG: HAMP domain-containing protein [Cyanobacteria bacterium J083]|nr:MAG: HAMP domain-containing protein [Cyanobacteria bacterium J083]